MTTHLPDPPTTRLATSTADDVFVRGRSLCHELMGRLTFTEMMGFLILGRVPTPAQTAVVDACLVALMEHGLTPSALAARLTWTSAPEALQGAVAAGLLGVGSLFVGTAEGCAKLLAAVVSAGGGSGGGADGPGGLGDKAAAAAEARRIAETHRAGRTPVPGFGHPIHKPDDPRAVRLLAIAQERGVAAAHVEALGLLAEAVDACAGKHLTVNVTGAIAAVLGDCGVPAEIMRGFALVSRCAGLVGHIFEEQQQPAMRAIWEAAEAAVPYGEPPSPPRP